MLLVELLIQLENTQKKMVVATEKCCSSPFIYFYFLSHMRIRAVFQEQRAYMNQETFFAQTLFLQI